MFHRCFSCALLHWRNHLLNLRPKKLFPSVLCWLAHWLALELILSCSIWCPQGAMAAAQAAWGGGPCRWNPPTACPHISHERCTEQEGWPPCCGGQWQPQSPQHAGSGSAHSRIRREAALQTSTRKELHQALAPSGASSAWYRSLGD